MSALNPVMTDVLAPFFPGLRESKLFGKQIIDRLPQPIQFIARITVGGKYRDMPIIAYTAADATVIAVETFFDGDEEIPAERLTISVSAVKGN